MAITGAAVAYSAVGGLVLYSGIKGATLADTAKAVLAGNLNVTGTQPIDFSPGNITSSGGGAQQNTAGGSPGSKSLQSGAPSAPAGAAQAYAQSQLAKHGWNDAANWNALVALWNQESGWNANAVNPSSGAYGIPQALPSVQGHPYALGDYKAQIDWGLDYIAGRYGSPVMAEAHEKTNGWY